MDYLDALFHKYYFDLQFIELNKFNQFNINILNECMESVLVFKYEDKQLSFDKVFNYDKDIAFITNEYIDIDKINEFIIYELISNIGIILIRLNSQTLFFTIALNEFSIWLFHGFCLHKLYNQDYYVKYIKNLIRTSQTHIYDADKCREYLKQYRIPYEDIDTKIDNLFNAAFSLIALKKICIRNELL